MATLKLHITQERLEALTLADMIAFEDAMHDGRQFRVLRDMLAKFMYDGEQFVPQNKAFEFLNKLSLIELREASDKLMDGIQGAAVNPTSGG